MSTELTGPGRIAVLLSTYNGQRFLPEQLESLLVQTHRDWTLVWRDDGSRDGTTALLRSFAAQHGRGRCIEAGRPARLGPTESFIALLRAALPLGFDIFAFADQDDVWLPEKLARGRFVLASVPAVRPALYCARQVFVDERLVRLGLSRRVRDPGFPGALAQNVATGCTLMMNRRAAELVGASRPPAASYHDWWSYLLVAGAGGAVLADDRATVLYRQHAGNLVGAPASLPRRGVAALRRGPGVFMNVFRQQVLALAAQPNLLSDEARDCVMTIARALQGGVLDRARALRRTRGLARQTWSETLLFGFWFLIG